MVQQMLLLTFGDSIRRDASELLRNVYVFLLTWQKILLLLLNYLLSYLLIYLPTYLLAYLFTCLLYLLTYLIT